MGMAEISPTRILRATNQDARWKHEPTELEVRHSWKEGQPVGGWALQITSLLHRGLPQQAAQVSVRCGSIPPQHLPLGHSLSFYSQRRQGLEAGDHHQANPPRNSGFVGESKQ